MAELKDIYRKDDWFYILTKDRWFQKADKNYGSFSAPTKCITLLRGEILIRHVATAVDENHGSVRLHPYDKPAYFSDCPLGDVEQIDEEEAKLLLPISTMGTRFKLFDSKALKDGKKMTKGSKVFVKVKSVGSSIILELRAIIRYKGPLPKEKGTWFGVELMDGAGRGTTTGIYRAQTFFKCQQDCGLFVSLDKLKLCDKNKETKNESKTNTKEINGDDGSNDSVLTKVKKFAEGVSNFVLGDQSQEEKSLEKQDIKNCTEHNMDDRVWVYINDKLYGGYIKYIGRVPGGTETLAGIRLDHDVGMGNGDYNGKQLFTCEMNHAHFTPIETLISQKKLQELYGPAKAAKTPAEKNDPSLVPQTSEDILKMESRFANQSEDQTRKEQESILKKIQQGQKIPERKDLKDAQSSVGQKQVDERWTMKNENQPKHNNHVSHATLEVNKHIKDPSTLSIQPQQTRNSAFSSTSNLEVGSMVEVLSKHQAPKYGLIRWIGFIPNNDKKIAGLELEEELTACSDGTFLGKRYFTCPSGRGFFVHLHNCLPDSRFQGTSLENSENKRLSGTDFGRYDSPVIDLDTFVPPPKSMEIYLKQKAGGKEEAKGIQGHHNSCYLDATLFAAFAFSSVMDSILLRPPNKNDIEEYDKVQTVLRNKIVYPLRSCGFVRADRVLELRQLLDRLGNVTGLIGEEKDPEEFLTTLLEQVLKTEPFIKVKSGKEVSPAYFYQVLADKDSERVLPSVEELLKKSFHQTEVKLTELPSCLLVQMPRFGKGFKMYQRILPSLTINIGELVENYPQDCAVCGRLAKFHCRDCFCVTSSQDTNSSGNFCKDCNERVHSHVKRTQHKYLPIVVSRLVTSSFGDKPVKHHEMQLFAVICIETSHYVTFAKCEEPDGTVKWCFFDSMADRVGSQNGYNVPAVTECPEVIEWLSSEKTNIERIINTDDKDMPDRVRRLLGDAYVCLYASKEMAMYK